MRDGHGRGSDEADLLSQPYRGSDACATRDGLMAARVTTFDGSKLKFKP